MKRSLAAVAAAVAPAPAAVFVLALAGCATGFTGSTVEDFGTYRVDVTNDLAPRAEIHLVSEDGSGDLLLGTAPVEGTTTFRIDVDRSVTYRLRAVLPRGQEAVSDAFEPGDDGSIRWVLSENVLGPVVAEDVGLDVEPAYRGSTGMRRPTGARMIPPGT